MHVKGPSQNIDFDTDTYFALIEQHSEAVRDEKDTFVFKFGEVQAEMVTDYAGHLIKYLSKRVRTAR